ncbi:MAG: magnesium transporter CorA [Blautia sp.]|nr:magnesium transporter CorA [Blautia sp.]
MYYQIKDTLIESTMDCVKDRSAQFVAILTPEEWQKSRDSFDMVIDMELEAGGLHDTKAIVNYDSLTGSFSIPDRENPGGKRHTFAFALDEKGIVLIDGTGYAGQIVERVRRTKKWKLPGLERFLYDFLESIIAGDYTMLEKMEHDLDRTEREILEGHLEKFPLELNRLRGDLLDLRLHYEQLIDFSQELEENENGFFRQENLRYFRLFTDRVDRLQDMVTSERDYIMQLRDLLHSELDVKQNRIMTVLTVITSIFLPLTLIVGWYGMNFANMPELTWRWGYPAVILVSALILIISLIFFHKKKWL